MDSDGGVPVSIGRPRPTDEATEFALPGDLAGTIGVAAAEMLTHLSAVLDREDRLESGTGNWLATFSADLDAKREAARQGVLRSLRIGLEETSFQILRLLAGSSGRSIAEVSGATGLPTLSVAERISDLVSAGLATKLPEANQVAIAPAGASLVELVSQATEVGARRLDEKR